MSESAVESASRSHPPHGEREVSVVVPIGSRHDDVGVICQDLRRVLASEVRAAGYEVLFVDDGADASTRAQLRETAKRYPEVRVIRLQRQMGEAVALAIGAQAARGEIIITLDSYLHVSIEAVPKLLLPLRHGTDLVCAWRSPRQEGALSRFTSDAFNALTRWMTKVPVHDLNCRTRAMRRRILQDLPLYGDLHRFLPIFAARRGYVWREIQVPQQPGKHEVGASDPRAYLQRFFDLLTIAFLTRFVKRPLHFFGLVGLTSLIAGLAIAGYLTFVKVVLGMGVGHRPMLLLSVLLIVVGIQIASIGLLAELLVFTHARDLKDYVVEDPDDH